MTNLAEGEKIHRIVAAIISLKFLTLGADHIVRRQRSPDPLQLELAYWLDLHGVLDLHQHYWAVE